MKKRILSILLMCCMVLTLLPVQALAEDSAYTVGEDTGVSARALARTAGTKLKADNIATYVANGLGSGVYTLAEDVTISGTLRVTGEATVDLNGYVLRYAEEAEPGSIFRVTGGKTLTMTDSRTNYGQQIDNLIRGAYGSKIKVFDQTIPRSVRAAEISAVGKSIFQHDPKGKVAEAYKSLTEEVMANAEKQLKRVAERGR